MFQVLHEICPTHQRTHVRLDLLQRALREHTSARPQRDKLELARHLQTNQLADERRTAHIEHAARLIVVLVVVRVGRQLQVLDVAQARNVLGRVGHFVLFQQMLDHILLRVEASKAAHDNWLLQWLLCDGAVAPTVGQLGLFVFLEARAEG